MSLDADPPALAVGTTVENTLTLVVGSGGLLGGALTRYLQLARRELRTLVVNWQDSESAGRTVAAAAAELVASGRPWRIAWCAGAGVVGTTQDELDAELQVLRACVNGVRAALGPGSARGVFFLASSAGGVYAGSDAPPFSETTEPRPLAPYGRAKLAAESLVSPLGLEDGVSVVLGRLSNLYGPGQDLRKPQGLVSQLCRAQLTRQPISIYVPLETARDYLYIDDAARMLSFAMESGARASGAQVKIICSQRTVSIGALLAEISRVGRRRPPVILGTSPLASFQVRDLSFRSSVWPTVDHLSRTTLPDGVSRTLSSLHKVLTDGAMPPRA